jgi:hypothetical protein
VVAQKIKPAPLAGIDNARLDRVQRQSRCLHPLAQLSEYCFGLSLALA